MFRGINAVNLDSKGRMSIPTRYRPQLEEVKSQLVITIDTEDACLLLYPLNEWEMLENKLERLPSFNRWARRVQRLLIGHATEVELDTNGRILVPALLRDYAELEKEVILVGQGRKFEIWAEPLWTKSRENWIASDLEDDKDFPAELLNLSI
ncbi:MAG: division/cell wall cluster transcriptional repressor MraZ [Gammaproteobacteria bacterium]|nr:division/cell wall cluster transcriptional repressor MraZ [Gammaproteobacteria bacterium]